MPAAVDAAELNGPVEPPKPKTELEAIQMQANQVTDESLESTRRMLALCEEVSPLLIPESILDRFWNLILMYCYHFTE